MIRVIITGGTIDKHYNEINGQLTFSDSTIPDLLKTARCTVPIVYEQLELLDSLDMSDDDRHRIKKACLASNEKKIIITHGTDTMVETGLLLKSTVKDKTIVLTGAMVPYRVSNSDAMFNLGTALCAVQSQQPGTYIAMNGFVFSCDQVRKNKKLGRFEAI